MTALTRIAGAALVTMALLGTPGAHAQETGVVGEIERTASTTPQEKVEYATQTNEEIRTSIQSITELVETARRDNNAERLQCLNTRLSAIRALVQVSEAAEVAMREAIVAGRIERADHEFRKIAVARTKTRQLQAEADRCVDDSGPVVGETVVAVDGDDVGADEDMSAVPYDPFDLGFDPPEASPFW